MNIFLWLNVACVTLLLSACQPTQPLVLSGPTMGTTYHITIAQPPANLDQAALQKDIEAILQRIDFLMSTYRQDSVLSKFNNSHSTQWQTIPADLFEIIHTAKTISAKSNGAFDITVGPLVNLWGFGAAQTIVKPPAEHLIQNLKKRIGYQKLLLQNNPPALRKIEPTLYLDLSGIASGYAVDKIAAHLETVQIHNYMVEVGGELRVAGRNPQQQAWQIAIEKPLALTREIETIIAVTRTAVNTSGDYRTYFEYESRRYSHTIDPATGYPINHNLASVTVLHESCTWADGWATALMVLGPKAGLAVAEQEKLAALFIIKQDGGFIEQRSSTYNHYLATH
ncbi:MAG: FAD:protein FMN transferase [Gammaproteobacteria bacterium]|nr:FAD:protein FMN transferase [Gammaproteobacteria bacterium]